MSTKDAWVRKDSIVKSWLYATLSIPLLNMIFKKQATTFEIWENLEKVFRDNKASKIIQLDRELRNISLGNSSIIEYYNKIKSLADILEHMDAKVCETNLVAYMINVLSKKFLYITINIRHRDPPPSFWDAISILLCEEQQMLLDEQKESLHRHADSSSSPHVLIVRNSNTNSYQWRNNFTNNSSNRGGYRGGRGGRRGGRGGGRYDDRYNNGGDRTFLSGSQQQHNQRQGNWVWTYAPQPHRVLNQQGLLPSPDISGCPTYPFGPLDRIVPSISGC
uniref:Retrotransposon gag domain-containing protein n=1 Tax=Lactuca sativa TaxID=4236 RepID=A0A9R1VPU3_LACSA|nr:hypothetical protein LSAT_V11C400200700 [Lactuca sativa]